MASVKLLVLLAVTSVFVSTVYSQGSIADDGKDLLETVQKKIDEKTKDEGGLFSSFGEKVGQFYDKAVEKGKEAAKATVDAVSSSYDKIKEKAKEIMDSDEKKPE